MEFYDWAPVNKSDDYDESEPDEPTSLDIFSDEPSEKYGTAADHDPDPKLQMGFQEN
jgi:hypothetical protein